MIASDGLTVDERVINKSNVLAVGNCFSYCTREDVSPVPNYKRIGYELGVYLVCSTCVS